MGLVHFPAHLVASALQWVACAIYHFLFFSGVHSVPIYRLQWFFTQNKWGWSETHAINVGDINLAFTRGEDYVTNRVGMLGSQAFIRYIRASDVAISGDARVKSIATNSQQGKLAGDSDIPNTSIDIRLDATDVQRRTMYLRGQPDDVVRGGGIFTPSADFNLAYGQWRQWMLTQSGLGMVHLDRNVARRDITSVAVAGGVTTVTTAVAHTYGTLDKIRIRGGFGMVGLNGIWTIQVTSPTTFILIGAAPVGTYIGGATSQLRLYTFTPYSRIEIIRATRRNTGGPFDRPVGRRRRRAPTR